MGHNTTVVVINDALDYIRDDPEFGRKLADAIQRWHQPSTRGFVHVEAGRHGNAAIVVAQHHADTTSLIAVGGNIGQALCYVSDGGRPHEGDTRLKLLRAFAALLGYKVGRRKGAS